MFTELLARHGVTAYRCARDIGVTTRHTYDLAARRRAITPILALRLARYFGNTASLWMQWQAEHDLAQAHASHLEELRNIRLIGDANVQR